MQEVQPAKLEFTPQKYSLISNFECSISKFLQGARRSAHGAFTANSNLPTSNFIIWAVSASILSALPEQGFVGFNRFAG
ncbi:MAG: hypothetical protein ACXVJB_05595 [Mucilaginibacter sp.]